ncbi:DNA cytosine methyltransferase [Pseudomonas monteilii]|jgi:DNA (cytosine-5)-methyltransferase 1|uniref:DNA cytosine methyltransferase n=1 Tax=Pseudomonadota TaxID=1224 RepID=UPI001E56B5C3|nr:DNA cytosine methyltransferase [Pseudomonas monteilii]MCE0872562.1 DNA cytosine methyltransferase [Pseudomonas monteilii]
MNPQPQPAALRFGSVCSGIEAASLAWEPLGLQAAWFSEIDPFACAVLAHRYPAVPNLGDMTRIAGEIRAGRVEAPDILVGGPPCQAFSIAGNRQGLTDPRGALTLSYVELANAIDQTRLESRRPPATLVFENVPGILSDCSNAFGCLLGALAGESRALEPPGPRWTYAGYVSGPRRHVAWRVLDAQHFGVAQRRRRVFLVASCGNDLDPVEVLFECQGLRGDSGKGDAPWQEAARAAGSGPASAGGYGGVKQDYGKVTVTFGFGNGKGPTHTAASLMAGGPKHDICTESYLVQSVAGFISHTLDTANGGKGSGEDGTGKGVPIIAFTAQGCGADAAEERAPTLRAGGHRRSHANAGVVPATAFAENSHGELRFESGHGQVTGALSTGGGKPGQGCPVVLSVALRGRHGGLTAELGDDIAPTLRISSGGADKGHVLVAGYEAYFRYDPSEPDAGGWSRWRVRRLMPVECERLQGMPDDWTQVPYRGKPAADAPRYKAIGNSMAVPCMAWLGQRLLQALDKAEAHGCVLVRDAP